MRVFEYGILKDGQHRLDYVGGRLYAANGYTPNLRLDQSEAGKLVMGEIHELSREELSARDGLYTGYRRVSAITMRRKHIQVYVLDGQKRAALLPDGMWLTPRVSGSVYVCRTADGARFRGSKREILEQLYCDQVTVEGRRRFKEEVARRIEALAQRVVRTETVDLFFEDLQRARCVRLRRIWPRKAEEGSN
jgi:hypothetical protein